MSKHYSEDFLKMIHNQIPIDGVITHLLHLEVRHENHILRFRCPLCDNFHTATNHQTNLARCFDCQKKLNPIDLVITVGKCGFIDAGQLLKDSIDQ